MKLCRAEAVQYEMWKKTTKTIKRPCELNFNSQLSFFFGKCDLLHCILFVIKNY